MKGESVKNITKKFSSTIKTPTDISQSSIFIKKKNIPFRKASSRLQMDSKIPRFNFQNTKSSTFNIAREKTNLMEFKKIKTCFPTNEREYLNIKFNRKNKSQFQEIDKENLVQNLKQSPIDKQFLLFMFDHKIDNSIQSANQIPHFSTNFLKNASFCSKIHAQADQINPFNQVQRQIQKKKQKKRVKSLSVLEKMSKKLLKDLSIQMKYDNDSNMMRKRYVSYFHSRNDIKNARFSFPNRQSIEKSHVRVQSVGYQIGMQKQPITNSSNYCMKLIQYCKTVENYQKLKKSVQLFTTFTKNFGKNCQKKHQCLSMINRVQ